MITNDVQTEPVPAQEMAQNIAFVLEDGRRVAATVKAFWDGVGPSPVIVGFEASFPFELPPGHVWEEVKGR